MNKIAVIEILLFIFGSIYCQYQFNDTKLQLGISCRNKTADEQDQCEEKTNTKWFKTENDKTDPKSICCARWDSIDCILQAMINKCNDSELEVPQELLIKYVIDLSSLLCKDYPFRSKQCQGSEQKESSDTSIASECISRLSNELDACDQLAKDKWNGTEDPRAKCCANWDSLECGLKLINDKCSKQERISSDDLIIKHFIDEVRGECGKYSYKSEECQRK